MLYVPPCNTQSLVKINFCEKRVSLYRAVETRHHFSMLFIFFQNVTFNGIKDAYRDVAKNDR